MHGVYTPSLGLCNSRAKPPAWLGRIAKAMMSYLIQAAPFAEFKPGYSCERSNERSKVYHTQGGSASTI